MAQAQIPEPIQRREPARLVGALIAFSAAVFVVLPLVGVRVTPELPAAIEQAITAAGAVVAIGLPIVQAELTRRRVYSPASRDQDVIEAASGSNGVQALVRRIDQRRHPRTVYDPDGDGRMNL